LRQNLVQLSLQRFQVLHVKALRHLKSHEHRLIAADVQAVALQLGDQLFLPGDMPLALRDMPLRALEHGP
jgi:hypothetical protein